MNCIYWFAWVHFQWLVCVFELLTLSSWRHPRRGVWPICWILECPVSPNHEATDSLWICCLRLADQKAQRRKLTHTEHKTMVVAGTVHQTHSMGCSWWSVWSHHCWEAPAQSAWSAPPGTTLLSPPSAPCKHSHRCWVEAAALRPLFKHDKPTNPPPGSRHWLFTRRLTSACQQSSDRKCFVPGFTVRMKPETLTALFTHA